MGKGYAAPPAPVLERAKGLLIGLYVPVHFALRSGHFRSAIKRRAVSHDGRPIPWYSYPAVDFLSRIDFTGADVLEYGGGQSTLWWVERAHSVTTVELDEIWREPLRALVRADGNLTVLDRPQSVSGTFDVIIIDGGIRHELGSVAVSQLRAGGMILFDNANGTWFPGPARAFEEAGLLRVDFYGYAPGARRVNVTSLAFRPDTPFLRNVALPPGTT